MPGDFTTLVSSLVFITSSRYNQSDVSIILKIDKYARLISRRASRGGSWRAAGRTVAPSMQSGSVLQRHSAGQCHGTTIIVSINQGNQVTG